MTRPYVFWSHCGRSGDASAISETMDGALAETRGSLPSRQYGPRDPAQSLLYQTIASNLETFLARQQTHVLFEPLELLARLAALTPAPRVNLVRFHGVLGPAAKWRSSVVPSAPLPNFGAETACDCENQAKPGSERRRNYSWAALMARVFEVDVLECPQCKGPLRILAAIHPPENTRKILECLHLPTRAPPMKAASKSFNEFS